MRMENNIEMEDVCFSDSFIELMPAVTIKQVSHLNYPFPLIKSSYTIYHSLVPVR